MYGAQRGAPPIAVGVLQDLGHEFHSSFAHIHDELSEHERGIGR
jgi:hypothetical protein